MIPFWSNFLIRTYAWRVLLSSDGLFTKVVEHQVIHKFQKQQAAAEAKLTEAFPELFITNEEIQAKQREQRVKLKDTPEFQQMLRHVSDLVKTEMEYRHQKNAELKALWLQIFTKK